MKMSKVFPDFNKMAGQNNRLPGHQQVSNAPRLAGFFLVGFFEQLDNDGLVLPEVRRSVAIATAFAFLCWAWHVRCHMRGSVLEQCFRLRHPSIPGLPRPGALLRSVCYATKLADNRKKIAD